MIFFPGRLVRYGIGSSPKKYVTTVASDLCPLLLPLPRLFKLSVWTSLADSFRKCDADDGIEDETTDGTCCLETDDAESESVQFPEVVLGAVST